MRNNILKKAAACAIIKEKRQGVLFMADNLNAFMENQEKTVRGRLKMNNAFKSLYDVGSSNGEKNSLPKQWFFSRILCFLVALGIWIYVVNITTQDFEKTFNLVDIDIDGVEELEDRKDDFGPQV